MVTGDGWSYRDDLPRGGKKNLVGERTSQGTFPSPDSTENLYHTKFREASPKPSNPSRRGHSQASGVEEVPILLASHSFKHSIRTNQCISKEKENCPKAMERPLTVSVVNTMPLHFMYLFFLFNSFFFFL